MSASSQANHPSQPRRKPQLVCPAGSLRALTLAIDAGADAVYMGLKDATNARNFAGLNFDLAQARDGIAYAHARGRHALMALNTFADARDPARWYRAVDAAAELGVDALICADTAVLANARDLQPQDLADLIGYYPAEATRAVFEPRGRGDVRYLASVPVGQWARLVP